MAHFIANEKVTTKISVLKIPFFLRSSNLSIAKLFESIQINIWQKLPSAFREQRRWRIVSIVLELETPKSCQKKCKNLTILGVALPKKKIAQKTEKLRASIRALIWVLATHNFKSYVKSQVIRLKKGSPLHKKP